MTILRKPIFEDIEDVRVRESIQWMYEYLIAEPLLKGGFQFFEVTTKGAVTGLKVPHNLGFQPKDIIVTSMIGGTATFDYTNFTTSYVVLTTTALTTVRFFGGTYDTENT